MSIEEKQDYCIYVHRRKDTGEVFYVGSGRKNRYRLKTNRSSSWNQISNEFGFTPEIVLHNLTEKQARAIETDFIIHYGDSVVNKLLPNSAIELKKECLEELFYYDESSPTCLKHKKTTGAINPKHKRFTGDDAGYFEYRNGNKHRVRVGLGRKAFAVHRVVYVLHNGEIPDNLVIDHIDGNPFNNKINNLRAVSMETNSRNLKLSSANTSGVKGVYLRTLGKYEVFVATWQEDSVAKSKAFYVCKYGFDGARLLATEYRLNKLSELEGFTDRGHFKE